MTYTRIDPVEVRRGAAHFGAVVGRSRPAVTSEERRAAIRAEVEREVNGEADAIIQRRDIEVGTEHFGDCVRHRDQVRRVGRV